LKARGRHWCRQRPRLVRSPTTHVPSSVAVNWVQGQSQCTSHPRQKRWPRCLEQSSAISHRHRVLFCSLVTRARGTYIFRASTTSMCPRPAESGNSPRGRTSRSGAPFTSMTLDPTPGDSPQVAARETGCLHGLFPYSAG
jgi:hypothetical protein